MRIILLLILCFPASALACASCGCTISSDWENSTDAGFKLDLRYDYLNQNQLRSGTSTISGTAASQKQNNGSPQEVEKYTANNYVTATADYTIDPDWKVDLQLPYIFRRHSTLGTNSDGSTPGPGGGQYDSNTAGIGDVKLIGRYQGFTPEHNWGLMFGLKLPTGSHSLTGTSTDPSAPVPVAIDRGLQPGTGTTDLITGLYLSDALNKNWDYYTQFIYQTALNSKDDYRPGNGMNLNLGLRFMGLADLTPQVQLNGRYVQPDSGINADTISTGGTLVYFSPGVTVPLSSQAALYTFVQLPIYQNLEGVQLAPTFTASLGGRYAF